MLGMRQPPTARRDGRFLAADLPSNLAPDALTRVLVVDDHPENAGFLARSLVRLGYAVDLAEGGEEAVCRIGRRAPDVVLMDILMPDLSGLEVLRRLRADPATADLPVVLVSGLDDTRDIVDGLALGANDYVTKPINLPVLHARLATQAALKRARDDLKRSAGLLAAEVDRRGRELAVAAQVQRSILPRVPPKTEGLATAWCYEPATEVGGDLFDVLPMPGGRTLLFVADAMGHGVQAALVVSTVKATLAAYRDEADDLSNLLTALDHAVAELFDDRYVTAAACVADPAAGTLRYALAGHPPILLAGKSGVRLLQTRGLPLGTDLGQGFAQAEVALEPRSAVLLYSDGVVEAQGPGGSQFGVAALTARLALLAATDASPAEIAGSLRGAVDEHRGPVPLADDLTLLAARLL